MQLKSRLKKFREAEGGNVIISFGLSSFVVFAMVGGAVDVGRSITMRNILQQSTDNAALNAGAPNEITLQASAADAAMAAALLAEARASTIKRMQELGGANVQITGQWLNDTRYEVLGEAKLDTSFLSAVPGFADVITVRTRSVVQTNRYRVVADAPTMSQLSYEAADYNQVWVYCYDPRWQQTNYGSGRTARPSDEGTSRWTNSSSWNNGGNLTFVIDMANRMNVNGRSDFTLISDNGGSTLPFTMPSCKEGETFSYALFNSRNNRTTPANWRRNYTTCGTSLSQTGRTCYQWFTDTTLNSAGVEQPNGTSPFQLETVLCENATCTQLTEPGTFIPGNNRTNRIPQRANRPCEVGKFMYFGWEDRPPQNLGGNGNGNPYPNGQADPGGDRDYDDIRLIVSCPRYVKDGVNVRLVQ